jgi:hypothetical protein
MKIFCAIRQSPDFAPLALLLNPGLHPGLQRFQAYGLRDRRISEYNADVECYHYSMYKMGFISHLNRGMQETYKLSPAGIPLCGMTSL